MTTSVESRLDETIRSEIERSGMTGLAIALIRGGETIWSNAYGTASIDTNDPLTTDTSFSVMSVTKTIVSTAAMQLRDRGCFQLDDPVNDHLAPIRMRNRWEEESPVRAAHLMTHTAGLPVGTGGGPQGKHSLEEYVAAIAECERRSGEEIIYANWGFDILGVLIERWSGLPIDQYLQQHVFKPLGMTTALLGNPSDSVKSATGHYRSFVDGKTRTLPPPDWQTIPASPDGGCWMSVTDLAKFLGAHLSGGRSLLSPETTSEMHRLRVRQGPAENGMGLGFRVTRANRRHLICHGGDGSGFTAFIGAHTEEKVGVALLINTAGQQVARSVIGNTALAMLVDTPQPRSFASAAIPDGVYRSTFWDVAIEAQSGDPPTLSTTEGLVVADELSVSTLMDAHDGLQGEGGMFHGFEVGFANDEIVGGVYPFAFRREGDLPKTEPVDENATLTGIWAGKIKTPMGDMIATLEITSETEGSIHSPLTGDTPLENFRAQSGRVQGEFSVSMPGAGDYRNFLRLAVRGGVLCGKTIARGNLGEVAMPTALEHT